MCLSTSQVERAKKCLDFAATIYVLHLLAVSLGNGFPRASPWCDPCSVAPGHLASAGHRRSVSSACRPAAPGYSWDMT